MKTSEIDPNETIKEIQDTTNNKAKMRAINKMYIIVTQPMFKGQVDIGMV